MNIFIGTWNVFGQEPKKNISSWLSNRYDTRPDIYVLGFQEIVDLNIINTMFTSSTDEKRKKWEKKLKDVLPQNFKLLYHEQLVGILLLIYVRQDWIPKISTCVSDTCSVAYGGISGCKGAVSIFLELFDTKICFICSHLASGKDKTQDRNSNYATIFEKFLPKKKLKNCDMIFWLGDLNYRLSMDNLDQVYKLIYQKKYKELLAKDQLLNEKKLGNAFKGFNEGKITFQPSYKYEPDTSKYQRDPNKKIRFPAWCDRILWREGNRYTSNINEISCLEYNICMNQKMSDHKPVYALFEFNIYSHKNLNKFMDNNSIEQSKMDTNNK